MSTSRITAVMNINDKASSGGYRIGKLIVNWGIGTTWKIITFAIPFSNTNYGFAVSKEATGDAENPVGYKDKTNTTITTGARYDDRNTSWIAIGY